MEEHKNEKTAKITKASLLKQLKQLDRYKKEHFTLTTAKLIEILRDIQEERTHIVEPIFEDEPEEEEYVKSVKTVKVKLPKPVVIMAGYEISLTFAGRVLISVTNYR